MALSVLNFLIRRVVGRFNFKGVTVNVPKGCFPPVLVSTGLLYDAAVGVINGSKGCEIGTGVGSAALSLAKRLGVEVVGTEISLRCLREAAANAAGNKLSSLFHPVACVGAQAFRSCSLDFVVVNPPYLPLPPSGPAGAAACGGERLELLNTLLDDAVRVLKKEGTLVFTTSSLTLVSGAELLRRRPALFDSVEAYLYVKL